MQILQLTFRLSRFLPVFYIICLFLMLCDSPVFPSSVQEICSDASGEYRYENGVLTGKNREKLLVLEEKYLSLYKTIKQKKETEGLEEKNIYYLKILFDSASTSPSTLHLICNATLYSEHSATGNTEVIFKNGVFD